MADFTVQHITATVELPESLAEQRTPEVEAYVRKELENQLRAQAFQADIVIRAFGSVLYTHCPRGVSGYGISAIARLSAVVEEPVIP